MRRIVVSLRFNDNETPGAADRCQSLKNGKAPILKEPIFSRSLLLRRLSRPACPSWSWVKFVKGGAPASSRRGPYYKEFPCRCESCLLQPARLYAPTRR